MHQAGHDRRATSANQPGTCGLRTVLIGRPLVAVACQWPGHCRRCSLCCSRHRGVVCGCLMHRACYDASSKSMTFGPHYSRTCSAIILTAANSADHGHSGWPCCARCYSRAQSHLPPSWARCLGPRWVLGPLERRPCRRLSTQTTIPDWSLDCPGQARQAQLCTG